MICTKLLTFEQAAERINVQPDTVRKWAAAGKLPRCKISGKTIRIPESAIEVLISSSFDSSRTGVVDQRSNSFAGAESAMNAHKVAVAVAPGCLDNA